MGIPIIQPLLDHMNQNLFNYGMNTQQQGEQSNTSPLKLFTTAYGPTTTLASDGDMTAASQTDPKKLGGADYNSQKDPKASPGSDYFWDSANGWVKKGTSSNNNSGTKATDNKNPYNISGGEQNKDWYINEFGQKVPVGQAGSQSVNLDEAFAPLFGALSNAENTLRSGYGSDVETTEKKAANYAKQYEQEGETLTGDVTDKQTDFNATLKSALQEAVKAYNALKQQAQSRFGGASSAGEAMGELAQQEYFKQQGNVNQEGVRGEREFAKEFNSIKMFVAQKKSDLDMWKEETLGTLKKNLDSSLANIQMQRGETEANKANARISIIQDSINRARAVEDQDKSFRQQLAIAAVNQLQESSGKTFTPQEINAYVTDFMGGNTSVTEAGTTNTVATPSYNKNASEKDELSQLQGLV